MRQPPVIGQQYTFTLTVADESNADLAKTNPTIDAINDFQISFNGDAAWYSLDNAPTIAPAGSEFIQCALSIDEISTAGAGGYILLRVADASASDGWLGGAYRFDIQASPFGILSDISTAQMAIIADTGATETAVLSAIGGLNDLDTTEAQAAAAAALAAYDPPTKAELNDAQAAIIADTGATETAVLNAISALGATSVTVVSTVIGGAAEVYESDAWIMQFTLAGVDLTDYDTLIFAVKHTAGQADDEAMLLVRSDTGLIRINKAAPADAGNGSLTGESVSQFSVVVESAETAIGKGGNYTWWLKGIDTDADPDRPRTLASGPFAIKRIGIGATA